jgi:hypothetical protein
MACKDLSTVAETMDTLLARLCDDLICIKSQSVGDFFARFHKASGIFGQDFIPTRSFKEFDGNGTSFLSTEN